MRAMPVLLCLLVSASCKKDADDIRKEVLEESALSCEAQREQDRIYWTGLLDACVDDAAPAAPQATECAAAVPEFDATYVVDTGDHVVLTNKRPVGDRVRWFRKDDDCRLDPGGTMTILDVRKAGDELGHWIEYLVRYERPPETSVYYVAPEHDAEPYLCPTGATFYHEDPLFIAHPS